MTPGRRRGPPDSAPDAAPALLQRATHGDAHAASQLMPLVYDELRRLAASYVRRERRGQTLQPTALVHEAYMRLVKPGDRPWTGRTHFVAIAAMSMRQVLVDRARRRDAAKRGGGIERVTLQESLIPAPDGDGGVDLVALDQALTDLAVLDPLQSKIVELRYFGGLTVEETAEAVDLSPATVKRHWTVARAFLKRALAGGHP